MLLANEYSRLAITTLQCATTIVILCRHGLSNSLRHMGEWGTAPHILHLSTGRRRAATFAPWKLYG